MKIKLMATEFKSYLLDVVLTDSGGFCIVYIRPYLYTLETLTDSGIRWEWMK